MLRRMLRVSALAAGGAVVCVSAYNPAKGYPRQQGNLVTLKNGRNLCYLEQGDPDGTNVVFCLHGAGGSRFEGNSFGLFDDDTYFKSKSIRIMVMVNPQL